MNAWYKNTLFIALTVSVFLHGIVLFLRQNEAGDAATDRIPAVVIQVELADDGSSADDVPVTDKPLAEKVVAVARDSAPLRQQKSPAEESPAEHGESQLHSNAEVMPNAPAEQLARSLHDAGDRADQLRRFVYEAINREKRYPYMAQRQRREGLVKLNFVMHPDGKVTNIAVVQSSRFAILDNAAKRAVEAISPFQLAAEYLQVQHNYNVDIDFRLN